MHNKQFKIFSKNLSNTLWLHKSLIKFIPESEDSGINRQTIGNFTKLQNAAEIFILIY